MPDIITSPAEEAGTPLSKRGECAVAYSKRTDPMAVGQKTKQRLLRAILWVMPE